MRWHGLLWHPEQKLWNRPLVDAIAARLGRVQPLMRLTQRLVVAVDSALLMAQVLKRRAALLGVRSLVLPPATTDSDVLYIDCGVHKEGREIRCMRQWFTGRGRLRVLAFEAGTRQYEAAREALVDVPDLDLRHHALVGPHYRGSRVILHNWAKLPGGEGDSLFAERWGDCELVPATHLSDVLRSDYGAHRGPILLRMNIEGAECHVIDDLIDAGLCDRIDGFHGSWDDLSFIDEDAADRFRQTRRQHGIRSISFNGRDLQHPLRRAAIRFDVRTSIGYGERRRGTTV